MSCCTSRVAGARGLSDNRFAAACIDLVAMIALGLVAGIVMTVVWDRTQDRDHAQLIGKLLFYGGALLYTTMEIWTAATPGKLLLGLHIRQQDGTPADFWRLVLRWSTKQLPILATILYIVTAFGPFYLLSGFSSLLVAIGCFFAGNDDRLTWHDQWAHTAVYWKRAIAPPPVPRGLPSAATSCAPGDDL